MSFGFVNTPSVGTHELGALRNLLNGINGDIATAFDISNRAIAESDAAKITADTALGIANSANATSDGVVITVDSIRKDLDDLLAKPRINTINITFAPDLINQPYTITGGSENINGIVPESGFDSVNVIGKNTTYTISSAIEGITYSTSITTGPSFGTYAAVLNVFKASINVTTVPGALATATCEGLSFRATADNKGLATIVIRKAGTYTLTATKGNKASANATVDVLVNNSTYSIIMKISITAVPSQRGSLTYTGSVQSPTWDNYNADELTIGGTINETNIGNHVATFTPKPGYQWSDGSTAAKDVIWTISREVLTLPAQTGTLTYNGGSQSPTWDSNYDSSKMILSVTPQTNAGNYTATFTPRASYCWTDGSTLPKTVEWTINKIILTIPSQSGTLTYNGSSQSPSWNNNDSSKITLNVIAQTNAGNYTATFTLKDTTNYQWNDGTSTAKNVSWTIGRAIIPSVPSQSNSLTYTGSAQSPTWNGYNSVYMTIGGTYQNQSNAGNYTAKFTPTSNYQWNDGSTGAKNVTWTINRFSVAIPTLSSTSLTYTGSSQTATFNNYNSTYMNVSGNTGTNAGNYNATFSLKNSNYQWSDSTTGTKTLTWTISKANATLSLNKTSVSLSDSTTATTISITRTGDGAITVISSDTNVVTATLSGTTITLTSIGNGSATITVSMANTSNYNAPVSVSCNVTVAMTSVSVSPVSGVSYVDSISDLTATQLNTIAKMISNNPEITCNTNTVYYDDGHIHRKIDVGDNITVTIAGETHSLLIMGFNHYDLTDLTAYDSSTATGKAGILFQTQNCMSQACKMNSTRTNVGGWEVSELRTKLRGLSISGFSGYIKTVRRKVGVGSPSNSSADCNDTVFLPTISEITGDSAYDVLDESRERYKFFKNGGTTLKGLADGSKNQVQNWTCSPSTTKLLPTTPGGFYIYSYSEGLKSADAENVYAAPCFCI